jgi:hypothetical protein
MVKQKSASKSRDGSSSSRSDTNPVTTMLLDFATRLDAHLARFAVPPSKQLKPNMAVNTNSCKAAWGESFSVRLVDASNTHELKQAEVEDPSVVMQTANKNPAAAGEYTFFAKQPGKTKLTLVVARADNFAVGTAEVQVEVTDTVVRKDVENVSKSAVEARTLN